jgi:hypothetical protein
VELENCKAGILPPAFGSSSMLNLADRTGTKRLNSLMKFKLFEHENVTGPSDPIPSDPKPNNQLTSCSCKRSHVNDTSNEDDSNDSTINTVDRLPPLPVNGALAQAVSQVQTPMDGWAPLHIFKLFVVLVDPPPGLDLSAVEGLRDYLALMQVKIGGLIENGLRMIASRCWWALLGKCFT